MSEAEPLGLYVHWPFCARKCPYCDFNSHVRDAIDQPRWRRAMLRALDLAAERTPGRIVGSIFFGGGTPSLMPPETTAAILERVRLHWPAVADLEVTLEANPGSVEAARFRDFRAAGINRVSIGVQSLDDQALAFLGRAHGAEEARRAAAIAARTFPRHSIDLIYALPGQTAADWRAALGQALDLAGSHVSAYALTIEPGTAFHTLHRQGRLALPDDDTAADLYEVTQEVLEAHGFAAYEVSNHAREGAAARHNLGYWRYRDYLGIGPGAHGRLTRDASKLATVQWRLPERWLEAIEQDGAGPEESETVSPRRRVEECAMMGLRLAEGLPIARLMAEDAGEAERLLGETSLDDLVEGGFLTRGDRITATPRGRLVLNAVLARWLG